jgi:hypothetical protein
MKLDEGKGWQLTILILGLCIAAIALSAADEQPTPRYFGTLSWFDAGKDSVLPADAEFDNLHGKLGVVNSAGPTQTKGHPFFEPLGTNGRAERVSSEPPRALALDEWQGSSIRCHRRLQLSQSSAGSGGLAFAAFKSRPVPRFSSMASQEASRVHD